jgi:hypothetical protein
MRRTYEVLGIAVLLAVGTVGPAYAERAQKQPRTKRPPVIIDDRTFRAPPPPHERSYYGPAPTIQPPMERVPLPAPLAQPPPR